MTTDEQRHHTDTVNVATRLRRMAELHPYQRAVVAPVGRDAKGRITYAHLTFRQLDEASDRLAHGLESIGIRRGTRTVLMVKPCLEFFTLTFALFKTGAVPVVVDPGMGVDRMLQCLQESRPHGFIGIPLAHMLRTIRPGYFKSVQSWVTVGRRWFWGGHTLDELMARPGSTYAIAETHDAETAAILFTTGSTGPAKGVVYTHGIFDAQVKSIRRQFSIEPGEIDLPTFPLFALFDPALGMTAVIPDMDPTRPAKVNPRKIIEAVLNQGVTNMFASPALLNRVGRYGRRKGISLPSLKRVISAGAPTLPVYVEQFSTMLCGDAQVFSGYGATEAMPVSSIGGKDILSETRYVSEKGGGTCVGRPVNGMRVRMLSITDDPIPEWSSDVTVSRGEIGEIAVQGKLATPGYFERPGEDAGSKIRDGDGFWHRMGDLGWLDDQGRIWFCGRKGHRVVTENGTLFTIPCEAIFNNHPKVFRSALVGVGPKGNQEPVMCVELEKGVPADSRPNIEQELLNLARDSELTRTIQTVLFHREFPVDIRHNSKIFREELALWAATKLGR